jgi:hypothetical protein
MGCAAENGSGKISVITVNGDKGTVAAIRAGLKTPTAVRARGRYDLDRRTGRRLGGVDSYAEMMGRRVNKSRYD